MRGERKRTAGNWAFSALADVAPSTKWFFGAATAEMSACPAPKSLVYWHHGGRVVLGDICNFDSVTNPAVSHSGMPWTYSSAPLCRPLSSPSMNDAFLANKRAPMSHAVQHSLPISKGKTVQNVTRKRAAPPRGNEITFFSPPTCTFRAARAKTKFRKAIWRTSTYVSPCLISPPLSSYLKIGATFQVVRSFCDGQITIGVSVIVYLCEPAGLLPTSHHVMRVAADQEIIPRKPAGGNEI